MKTTFWLLIGLQVVVLFALLGFHFGILVTGTPVLLRTQPVDPRSLFQGNYVQLTYEISQLDRSLLRGKNDALYNETVYVTLERRGKYWRATGITTSPPSRAPGRVYLRGTANAAGPGEPIYVTYGIESFFASEQQALALERMGGSGTFDVEVAVSKRGRALIKRVFYEGKPIALRQLHTDQ